MTPWITSAVCVGAVVFGILFFLPMLRSRRRRLRQLSAAQRRAQQAFGASRRSGAQRATAIENWLVSKPALAHDDVCDFAMGPTAITQAASDETTECSICFESFQPNDIVSWSPNPACCKQVFHHGCLKEWLLYQNGCPWCRETVLPVDGYSLPVSERKQIHDLLVAGQQRSLPCFYCLEHGIIRPAPFRARGDAPQTICSELEQRQTFLFCRSVLADSGADRDDESVHKSEATDEELGNTIHYAESDMSMDYADNLDIMDVHDEDDRSTDQSDVQIDQPHPTETLNRCSSLDGISTLMEASVDQE